MRPLTGSSPTHDAELFQREGDFWTVTFQGTTLHIRDTKGMHYLAQLLRHPDHPLDVRTLAAAVGTARRRKTEHAGRRHSPKKDDRERQRSAVSKRLAAAIKHLHEHHPPLGRFLRVSIHTGYECVYETDPGQPVRWKVN